MPTYQYVCSKCEHEFEVFQPIADPALTVCPKAHCPEPRWAKGKVKRRIGAGAGLLFKGSGFYVTDYRTEGYRQAAKKEADAAAPKKTDGAGAKAEAKSARKAEKAKPAA
jgi:putative FmdB family regulatory protein